MATEKDVLEIFKLLKANYPRFDVEDPAALLDSWTQRFAAVEAAVLRQAAELHMDHSKWFPSRAELLELIEEAGRLVGKGEQDEAAAAYWEEYWGKVNPLRERRKELEDRFHFDRRLDAGDWEALAAAFDAIQWDASAAHCRERIRIYSEILEVEGAPVLIRESVEAI